MNFRNLLLVTILLFSQTLKAQVTRIQVINNCGDVSLQGADVYIDNQVVVDDLFFRTASNYFDIKAGTPVRINIADNLSTDTTTAFYSTTMTFNPNNKYVLVLNGVKSTSGYSPLTPFSMDVYNLGKEVASNMGVTDALFLNASTDGPTFDVRTGISTIADNLTYGTFDDTYFEMAASGTVHIRFTNDRGNITTHNFETDFSNIGMSGDAIVVMTSGFVNTANNNNGPSFGLWAASALGGPMQEILPSIQNERLARIQFIHNTADTGVGKVDVYLNNDKKVDTLDYHYASEYIDIFAGANLPLEISFPGQTSFYNTNVNIDSGKTYIAVIHGIKSDTNYKPLEPFKVSVFADAKEVAANSNNTEVLFMHGATDAPDIDVSEGSNTFVTNLAYGNFGTGYTSFPSASTDVYTVDSGSSSTLQGKYDAQYNIWGTTGLTATVLASGFVTPDSNSGGPVFGLWAATSNGGALYLLPGSSSINELKEHANKLNVWPNPANTIISFEKKSPTVDVYITDISGRVIASKLGYKNNSVNIAGLTSGQYFIIVLDNNDQHIAQFIKQ